MSAIEAMKVIEEELGNITMELQKHYVYTGHHNIYIVNNETPAGQFMIGVSSSEHEYILHKLAPDLEVVEVQNNTIIFKLK